jgi:hypothetical protein
MYEWSNEVGYEADIATLRKEYPGLTTFEQYLRNHGWDRVRGKREFASANQAEAEGWRVRCAASFYPLTSKLWASRTIPSQQIKALTAAQPRVSQGGGTGDRGAWARRPRSSQRR